MIPNLKLPRHLEFNPQFKTSVKNYKQSQQLVILQLRSCTVSCSKRFLVESHRNMSKHQTALGNRSELLAQHTLQTVLRSSSTNFEEKITKAFFSADIALYKLTSITKTYFTTLVKVCHLKVLAEKQCCN